MTPARRLASISRLRKSRQGSIAVVFGLVLPLILLTIGTAIDMARWSYAKRTTMAAIDAAVLAGARALQLKPDDPNAATATAKKFYEANVSSRLALEADTVDFVTADNGRAITATGSASIKTTLLRVAGIDSLPVANATGAGFPKAAIRQGGLGGSNLEVSVMLDVTGSMCTDGVGPCTSSTKLDGLKAAAKELVDIVVSVDQSTFTTKIAIVPFSTRVRVGPDGGGGTIMTALTNLAPTWSGRYKECINSTGGGGSEEGGDWTCLQYQAQQKTNWKIMPCVTDRMYDSGSTYVYTDAAPGSGVWLNAHDGSRMPTAWDSTNTAATTSKGLTSADPATFWNYDFWGGCSDVAEGNQVLPLTSDKTVLKSRIDALEAYGATAGALGTAWAWYMLSPNWSSIWTGSSAPASCAQLTTLQASGAPVLRKVAILMTDGVYNTLRGWKGQDQTDAANHAKQLCTNMKAQGIEIFTVGLALNELTTAERTIAEDVLLHCGTDVHHFYQTLTVAEMKQAFQDIAVQLSSLALTK
jgi:Flp pilus assembly protein TadG